MFDLKWWGSAWAKTEKKNSLLIKFRHIVMITWPLYIVWLHSVKPLGQFISLQLNLTLFKCPREVVEWSPNWINRVRIKMVSLLLSLLYWSMWNKPVDMYNKTQQNVISKKKKTTFKNVNSKVESYYLFCFLALEREIAVGRKEFLYMLHLKRHILSLEPEGRSQNSDLRWLVQSSSLWFNSWTAQIESSVFLFQLFYSIFSQELVSGLNFGNRKGKQAQHKKYSVTRKSWAYRLMTQFLISGIL